MQKGLYLTVGVFLRPFCPLLRRKIINLLFSFLKSLTSFPIYGIFHRRSFSKRRRLYVADLDPLGHHYADRP